MFCYLDVIDRVPVVSYVKFFPSMHSQLNLNSRQNALRAIAQDDLDIIIPPSLKAISIKISSH